MDDKEYAIGIIGGSGLYQIDGLEEREEVVVDTPFGKPSDALLAGRLAGRKVYFLPRHGRGHTILPSELNHRANIYALRSLNVRWILCVTAVGSLREAYAPEDIVCPHQFFDRTSQREKQTFFGEGVVAHVSLADPVSTPLRKILADTAKSLGYRVHDGGTYVNMEGPAFSTRAESEAYRQLGFDVVGMTNLGEVKLAREAEIALATLAMITDYDCWKTDEAPVSAESVVGHLHHNADAARKIVAATIPQIPSTPDWPEHRALDMAVLTDKSLWPEQTKQKLRVILERFLD